MPNHFVKTIGILLFTICMVSSCTDAAKYDNQLTEQEKKEGWVLLFDGRSTKGWHLYNNDKRPSTWSVSNGELICGPDIRFDHMDLVTDKEYKNYDLRFDWKIYKGGNSGVFINVVEKPDISATWAQAPNTRCWKAPTPTTQTRSNDPVVFSGWLRRKTRWIQHTSGFGMSREYGSRMVMLNFT